MKTSKEFLVFRKSENTNSFGLFQMYLMAKDGEAYTSCANSLNVKEVGDTVTQTIHIDDNTGKVNGKHFPGHELTEELGKAPKDVIEEVYKLKQLS